MHLSILLSESLISRNINSCGSFDIIDVRRFEEWFTNETVATLPQAGQYTGPDEIREHVLFSLPDSPFVELSLRESATRTLTGIVDHDKCRFRIMSLGKMSLSDEYTEDGSTFLLTRMLNVDYSPAENKITSVALYLDSEFLLWFFGSEQLGNTRVWEWICDLMENECDGSVSPIDREECVEELASLPATEGGNIDGNTSSCRILHGVFAESNDDHCPHISFLPRVDQNGEIKCQESLNLDVADFFTELDVENYEQFKKDVGISSSGYEFVEDYIDSPREKADFGRSFGLFVSPLAHLSDLSFSYAVAIITWFLVCYTGFGSEMVVGVWAYRKLAESHRDLIDRWWIFAQFVFPMFLLIALGSKSSCGYIFLVAGLWKCGSPETVYQLLRCFASRANAFDAILDQLQGFFFGLGLVIHHSITSWGIVCIVQGLIPLDRITLSASMPLILQHAIHLLKYTSYRFYLCAVLTVEVWLEWEILYYRNKRNRNHLISSWILLVSHWMFLTGGAIKLLVDLRHLQDKDSTAMRTFPEAGSKDAKGGLDGSRSSFFDRRPKSVARFLSKLKLLSAAHLIERDEMTNPP